MRALIQRVTHAKVSIDDQVVGQIEKGLVIFIGFKNEDSEVEVQALAERIVNLRIFEDADGKTNLSILQVGATILAISQFTLYADCRRGRRPGFSYAAKPDLAQPLYDKFVEELERYSLRVAQGVFGAHMLVEIRNDGPFTILLDSEERSIL